MQVMIQAPQLQSETAPNWMDVSRVACGYGMTGKVQLTPTVWLCCVYLAAHDEERIDPSREALRLDKLLRDAASAWSNHTRSGGSRTGQCVFRYNPAKPMDESSDTPSFSLSVSVQANGEAEWATHIALDD